MKITISPEEVRWILARALEAKGFSIDPNTLQPKVDYNNIHELASFEGFEATLVPPELD